MEQRTLYGLVGHPLGHSFSKAFFTEKFEREGIDACYEIFDLDDLEALRALLRQHPDLCGFNVTIPYKEDILPYLDLLDPVAAEIGAVNTVKVMTDGRLKGYNTDVIGLEATLSSLQSFVIARTASAAWRDEAIQPESGQVGLLRSLRSLAMTNKALILGNDGRSSALILGTGGASKAVQYVLRMHGLPYHLTSRSSKRGSFTYEQLTLEIIQEHQLIINATPVGMAPFVDEAPMIPYEALTPGHVLFDLIYNPEETLFLKHGRENGAQTVNGLEMLHAQADAAWNIWNS